MTNANNLSWRENLQALKNVSSADNWNKFYPPVSETKLQDVAGNLDFKLARQLLELYTMTDGCRIEDTVIFGISHNELYGYNLENCNAYQLATLKESCTTHSIEYIFGLNGSGDFLVVDNKGSVLTIWHREPIEAEFVAESMEIYLDKFFYGARKSTE